MNKFLYTRIFVQDVENSEDRALIIKKTHYRAHRGLDENYKQISRLYYWPNLLTKLKRIVKFPMKSNITDTQLILIGEAPIPS